MSFKASKISEWMGYTHNFEIVSAGGGVEPNEVDDAEIRFTFPPIGEVDHFNITVEGLKQLE